MTLDTPNGLTKTDQWTMGLYPKWADYKIGNLLLTLSYFLLGSGSVSRTALWYSSFLPRVCWLATWFFSYTNFRCHSLFFLVAYMLQIATANCNGLRAQFRRDLLFPGIEWKLIISVNHGKGYILTLLTVMAPGTKPAIGFC